MSLCITSILLALVRLICTTVSIEDFKIKKWVSDPQVRSGATLTAHGNDLYLIMGFNECFDFTRAGCYNIFFESNEIWKYSTESNEWNRIIVSNITGMPETRSFHTATLTNCDTNACPTDSIVIFGGSTYQYYTDPIIYRDDFWYYDIGANTWTQIVPFNDGISPKPEAMAGQIILSKGDYIYSFGGINSFFATNNNLWRYSFITNKWELIEPINGIKPSPRYINRAVWKDNNKRNEFIIYGGNLSPGISDAQLWSYSINANQWTLLNDGLAPNTHPSGEVHVGLAVKSNNVYVFGGDTNINEEECTAISLSSGHSITDQVFKYNFDNKKWSELNVAMPPLKRFAFDQIGNTVYLYGGFNYFCDNPGSGVAGGHQIWNTNLYKWQL